MIVVREIPPELTYDIRHIVLRAGLPRNSCYWETDRGTDVFHLGGWIDGRQVGTATFQPEEEIPGQTAYRLRGMAVLPDARGNGVGELMLLTGEDRVRRMGIELMWCDARIGAVEFYKRMGWKRFGDSFEIPTAGLHYRMRRKLTKTNES